MTKKNTYKMNIDKLPINAIINHGHYKPEDRVELSDSRSELLYLTVEVEYSPIGNNIEDVFNYSYIINQLNDIFGKKITCTLENMCEKIISIADDQAKSKNLNTNFINVTIARSLPDGLNILISVSSS